MADIIIYCANQFQSCDGWVPATFAIPVTLPNVGVDEFRSGEMGISSDETSYGH